MTPIDKLEQLAGQLVGSAEIHNERGDPRFARIFKNYAEQLDAIIADLRAEQVERTIQGAKEWMREGMKAVNAQMIEVQAALALRFKAGDPNVRYNDFGEYVEIPAPGKGASEMTEKVREKLREIIDRMESLCVDAEHWPNWDSHAEEIFQLGKAAALEGAIDCEVWIPDKEECDQKISLRFGQFMLKERRDDQWKDAKLLVLNEGE